VVTLADSWLPVMPLLLTMRRLGASPAKLENVMVRVRASWALPDLLTSMPAIMPGSDSSLALVVSTASATSSSTLSQSSPAVSQKEPASGRLASRQGVTLTDAAPSGTLAGSAALMAGMSLPA
jgi:hypothetical protein